MTTSYFCFKHQEIANVSCEEMQSIWRLLFHRISCDFFKSTSITSTTPYRVKSQAAVGTADRLRPPTALHKSVYCLEATWHRGRLQRWVWCSVMETTGPAAINLVMIIQLSMIRFKTQGLNEYPWKYPLRHTPGLSCCRLYRHLRHRGFSSWQPAVPPVKTKLALWLLWFPMH